MSLSSKILLLSALTLVVATPLLASSTAAPTSVKQTVTENASIKPENLTEISLARDKIATGLASLAEAIRGLDSAELAKIQAGVETEFGQAWDGFGQGLRETRSMIVGFFLAITFVTGAVLLALTGSQAVSVAQTVRQKFWLSLFSGVLILLGVPLVAGLLAVSMIGLALAGIIMLLWLATLVIAKIMAGFLIGSLIIKLDRKSRYWDRLLAFTIGTLLLSAIVILLPDFGSAIWVTIFVITIGATTLAKVDLYKQIKKAKLI